METDALPFAGHVAVVTGASGGIGGAIAATLARAGATVHAVGRDTTKLHALVAALEGARGITLPQQADLTSDANVSTLVAEVERTSGRLDILVHSAGGIVYGKVEDTPVERFDELYAANLRGPYLLTQRCLPLLKSSRGQVVFINSSTGLAAPAAVGVFAATQHALKAIADALRDEVNEAGVRVLSVFPGRTATPRMLARYATEGRVYQPELLLQPGDVASVVVSSLALPRTAEVTNVSIRPQAKSY